MRFGIGGRLYATCIVVATVVIVASGLAMEGWLRGRILVTAETALLRNARLARSVVEAEWDGRPETAEAVLQNIASATGAQVTLVSANGQAIADVSREVADDVTIPSLVGAPSSVLRQKPELRQILDGAQEATSFRHNDATGAQLQYAAVALEVGAWRGGVRLGRPPAEQQAFLLAARMAVIVGGLIGLLSAILLSTLSSRYLLSALFDLVEDVRSYVESGRRESIRIPESDEIGGLAGTFLQMAEQLETTVASLATERDRFQATLEAMEEGVLAVDAEGQVTIINSAAQRLFGLAESPQGGMLMEAIRLPAVHETLREARRGQSVSREIVIHAPEHKRVHLSATPLQTAPGTVLVCHDVTELRRLESIRRDFISNVSHELRTPVSVIRANAETLMEGAIDDPVYGRKFLTSLHLNAERLSNLIVDVLDLARIESGKLSLREETCDLQEAAAHATETLGILATDKEIAIDLQLEDAILVNGDPQAIEQVLINLIGNAVKYTQQGGKVRVFAKDTGEAWEIAVEDNGPGIPLSSRNRLFERFYRVDPGRSKKMGGTGLGLAIVKHLVIGMGGDVGMRSAWPKGSHFWFTLPKATSGEQVSAG